MSNIVQPIETIIKQYGTGGDLYGGFVNLQNAQQPDLSAAEKTQATIDASVNFLKVVEAPARISI